VQRVRQLAAQHAVAKMHAQPPSLAATAPE
jgi:hypothetical protein